MTKEEILDYLMHTPYNSNSAVLKSMLGEGNWSRLLKYVRETPYNMNRRVLESFFSDDSTGDVAVVGTAIVGKSKIGG